MRSVAHRKAKGGHLKEEQWSSEGWVVAVARNQAETSWVDKIREETVVGFYEVLTAALWEDGVGSSWWDGWGSARGC